MNATKDHFRETLFNTTVNSGGNGDSGYLLYSGMLIPMLIGLTTRFCI